jgi:hypothetical protein
MVKQLKADDLKVEKEVSKFLDTYFYPNLKRYEVHRVQELQSQYNGKDVSVQRIDQPEEPLPIIVDEKAAIYYINSELSTFAFELLFKNQRGQDMLGWFINDELLTDCYLLMWLSGDETKYPPSKKLRRVKGQLNLKMSDLTSIECCTIYKGALRHYLEESGYSKEKLKEIACAIRIQPERLKDFNNVCRRMPFHFTHSGYLYEAPINIVINKELLFTLAKLVFIVDKNGYHIKKNDET